VVLMPLTADGRSWLDVGRLPREAGRRGRSSGSWRGSRPSGRLCASSAERCRCRGRMQRIRRHEIVKVTGKRGERTGARVSTMFRKFKQ